MTIQSTEFRDQLIGQNEHPAPELFIANDLPRGYPVTFYSVAFYYRFGSATEEYKEGNINIPDGEGGSVYGERKDCCKEIRVIVVVTTPSGKKVNVPGQFFADADECTVRESIVVAAKDSIFNTSGEIQFYLKKR